MFVLCNDKNNVAFLLAVQRDTWREPSESNLFLVKHTIFVKNSNFVGYVLHFCTLSIFFRLKGDISDSNVYPKWSYFFEWYFTSKLISFQLLKNHIVKLIIRFENHLNFSTSKNILIFFIKLFFDFYLINWIKHILLQRKTRNFLHNFQNQFFLH